jgi:ectoine hydroxylase-related dioxygenase (phytanoyl-CoA dioxygenase family)
MNFQDVSDAAVEIILHPRLIGFLRLIFNARPVAMQTLVFEYGSEQRGHMDFAYVHTRNPASLAAAWVACEDVTPDAGPLFYYLASHRLIPKYDFGDGNLLAFGVGPHNKAFEDYLEHTAVRLGLERREYRPRKGDVLFWHSALLHGGSARSNPHRTRRSIVAHYSTEGAYPEDSRNPGQRRLSLSGTAGYIMAGRLAEMPGRGSIAIDSGRLGAMRQKP